MKNTKTLRTLLIIGSILCTVVLWLTRHEWQNSLSAFASSQNAVWYNLMHVLGVSFWLLNSAAKNRSETFTPLKIFWRKKIRYPIHRGNRTYYSLRRRAVDINHGRLDILTGLLMGMILVTNMYLAYTAHVIFTLACFAVALFNIVFTSPKADLWWRWPAVLIGLLGFVYGYWGPMHFLVGEVIGMSAVAFGMLRQIWVYD